MSSWTAANHNHILLSHGLVYSFSASYSPTVRPRLAALLHSGNQNLPKEHPTQETTPSVFITLDQQPVSEHSSGALGILLILKGWTSHWNLMLSESLKLVFAYITSYFKGGWKCSSSVKSLPSTGKILTRCQFSKLGWRAHTSYLQHWKCTTATTKTKQKTSTKYSVFKNVNEVPSTTKV